MILDAAERKEIILHEAKQKAFALGLELIEDEGLLEEVTGLAEWPVVLIGQIEDQFMDVPGEILQTSMRTHQKYFALRDPDRRASSPTASSRSSPTWSRPMAARKSSRAMSACCARAVRRQILLGSGPQARAAIAAWTICKHIVFHAKLGTMMSAPSASSFGVAMILADLLKLDVDQGRTRGAARARPISPPASSENFPNCKA